ncbi:LacI family DNA-binding transcriptional regulator [Azohydromonas lata]|uniref:LacI family DNA-binding transcriptional regulator n=1 Tax=Azohydromonas lata TaxID=45677 RepID=A0ABU5IFY4_9BURK|nr:LacI family DNA-binding transcriptional regulator [Azohydromonas lata]MDZ5458022.1 LacI family DNA-binding transcriptional regulator [Azohydromonas lata]
MSQPAVVPVTIDDIAKAAGVHPATVSRALRGVSGKVSPDKRAEIERIARDLGYQPNAVAASLRTKQTNIAAIVVPDLGNPLFGPLVQGLEQALRQQRLLCLVVQTPAAAEERRELIVALANRQVSGLLILAAECDDPMLEAARQRALPTVLINRGTGDRHFSSVVSDDRESVRLVLEHLAGLGHRAVAHVAGPAVSSTGRARREAFVEMSRALGLGPCPVVEAKAFTRAAGQAATMQLLDSGAQGSLPTAIFAANDLIALGTLDVLRQRGLSVPRDVSLVGHNDMPLVDLIDPPLTTVRVPVEGMSAQGAALFLEHLRDPALAPSTRVLMPELVVRSSTAAPTAA